MGADDQTIHASLESLFRQSEELQRRARRALDEIGHHLAVSSELVQTSRRLLDRCRSAFPRRAGGQSD